MDGAPLARNSLNPKPYKTIITIEFPQKLDGWKACVCPNLGATTLATIHCMMKVYNEHENRMELGDHVLKCDFYNMEVFFTNGMLLFFHKSCASNFFNSILRCVKSIVGLVTNHIFLDTFLHLKVHSHLMLH